MKLPNESGWIDDITWNCRPAESISIRGSRRGLWNRGEGLEAVMGMDLAIGALGTGLLVVVTV